MDWKRPFWMMCGAALGAIAFGIFGSAEKGSVKATEAVAGKLGAAYEDFNVHDGWILPDSYTTRKLVDSIASDVAELERRKFKFPEERDSLAILQNCTKRLVRLHDSLIGQYKASVK